MTVLIIDEVVFHCIPQLFDKVKSGDFCLVFDRTSLFYGKATSWREEYGGYWVGSILYTGLPEGTPNRFITSPNHLAKRRSPPESVFLNRHTFPDNPANIFKVVSVGGVRV